MRASAMPSKSRSRAKRRPSEAKPKGLPPLNARDEAPYSQLLTLLEETRGTFSLLLVRAGGSAIHRDALLARLAADLSPHPLHRIELGRDRWDAVNLAAESIAS